CDQFRAGRCNRVCRRPVRHSRRQWQLSAWWVGDIDAQGAHVYQMKDDTHRVRLTLAGFTAIMLATGWALAAIAGPPRVPPLPPTPEAALNVLLGPTLPVDALVTVLVDATWLLWSWVILSLLLQLGILLAEILDHGRRWVRPFRE